MDKNGHTWSALICERDDDSGALRCPEREHRGREHTQEDADCQNYQEERERGIRHQATQPGDYQTQRAAGLVRPHHVPRRRAPSLRMHAHSLLALYRGEALIRHRLFCKCACGWLANDKRVRLRELHALRVCKIKPRTLPVCLVRAAAESRRRGTAFAV